MSNRHERRAAAKKQQISKTEAIERFENLRTQFLVQRQQLLDIQRKAQAVQLAFLSVLFKEGGTVEVPGEVFDAMSESNVIGWYPNLDEETGDMVYELLYGETVEGEVEETDDEQDDS